MKLVELVFGFGRSEEAAVWCSSVPVLFLLSMSMAERFDER